MESSFDCPICFDTYTSELKPLILPCGHNVCINCLSRLSKESLCKCPTCRKSHFRINPSNLTINYALIQSPNSNSPNRNNNRGNPNVLKDIQYYYQYQAFLTQISKEIKSEYERSQGLNKNCRDSYNGSIDFLINSLQNLQNKWNKSIDEAEKKNMDNYNEIKEQINKTSTKNDQLLEVLNEAYKNNAAIDANSEIVLASDKEALIFDVSFGHFNNEANLDTAFSHILHEIGGSLVYENANISKSYEKEPKDQSSPGNLNSKASPAESPIKWSDLRNPPKFNPWMEEDYHRKEQGKPITIKNRFRWFTQADFGAHEALPDWANSKINEEYSKGNKTAFIYDFKKRLQFKIDFNQMECFRYNFKTQEFGKARKLVPLN
ncbi:unnamed protein product [Blepharisma stoltei]|uniref:RING-type domain-containing protein n=1 Tax=Blepharisma stoltei TaxID=1481888 RepID=A0AAU9IT50_9CILI|nr:unnamed protein product [Blepharisma stoltei]